jgi:hypothetical protein
MAKRKKTILPIILMVNDKSSEAFDAFVLALRQLSKEDIPERADQNAVFEAGLLINPIDYLPGFQRRKGKSLTARALAAEVKGLRNQLKQYENFLKNQKDKEVDVYTLLKYISKKY